MSLGGLALAVVAGVASGIILGYLASIRQRVKHTTEVWAELVRAGIEIKDALLQLIQTMVIHRGAGDDVPFTKYIQDFRHDMGNLHTKVNDISDGVHKILEKVYQNDNDGNRQQ